jgi:hypothetical protein
MLTLTFPHYLHNDLKFLMKRLRKAMTRFTGGKRYKEFVENYGLVGTVRALEVTHGQNGWHPHFHILIFLKRIEDNEIFTKHVSEISKEGSGVEAGPGSPDEMQQKRLSRRLFITSMQEFIYSQWVKACAYAELPEPTQRHGAHLQEGDKAAEYVAKYGVEPSKATLDKFADGKTWDATRELVNANSKRGIGKGEKGITPFDLLRLAAGIAEHPNYDTKLAESLFREFSNAFFGFRQLFWSPKLKSKLGIAEVSDQEAAVMDADEAEFYCDITHQEWKALLESEPHARANLLRLAEIVEVGEVKAKLREAVKKYSKQNK